MSELQHYPEPGVSRLLFASHIMAPVWTVVRLYLGYQWLSAGWEKLHDPAWVGAGAGTGVSRFLRGALGKVGGEHPAVQAWFGWIIRHAFLPSAPALSYLVAIGETLVGAALVLGLLTGLAAFFGGLMNSMFLLAGTVSTNPLMFILATWLVLAWRVAGYYGLDFWVLARIGAPQGGFGRVPQAGD
ncbi:MAG: DoxX family protein [Deinococcales bacterium]